jgi:hypothetical protein
MEELESSAQAVLVECAHYRLYQMKNQNAEIDLAAVVAVLPDERKVYLSSGAVLSADGFEVVNIKKQWRAYIESVDRRKRNESEFFVSSELDGRLQQAELCGLVQLGFQRAVESNVMIAKKLDELLTVIKNKDAE